MYVYQGLGIKVTDRLVVIANEETMDSRVQGKETEHYDTCKIRQDIRDIDGTPGEIRLRQFLDDHQAENRQGAKRKKYFADGMTSVPEDKVCAEGQNPEQQKMTDFVSVGYSLDKIKKQTALPGVRQVDYPGDEQPEGCCQGSDGSGHGFNRVYVRVEMGNGNILLGNIIPTSE